MCLLSSAHGAAGAFSFFLSCSSDLSNPYLPDRRINRSIHRINRSTPGIKEATGDVSRVAELKRLAGQDFLLYSGDDETGAEFVLLGGDGVISVTSNVVPAVMHKMMMAALKKDKAATEALNKPLELLHQRLFLQSNPIPAKWALWRMGKIGAGIRPPLTALEEEFHKPLEEALKAAGAI